jgi:hypothetical protein
MWLNTIKDMIADYVIDIGPKQENTEAKSSVKEHTEI